MKRRKSITMAASDNFNKDNSFSSLMDVMELLRDAWMSKIHEIGDYATKRNVAIIGMHCGNLAGTLESMLPQIKGHPREKEIRYLMARAKTISDAADKRVLTSDVDWLLDEFYETYQRLIEPAAE